MTTASGETAATASRQRSAFWRSAVEVLAFVGPTTLLTGLLYYFGYVSAKAYYSYFGVSLSVLDLSSTTYLLRSADTFFRPVASLLILAVILFLAHQLLAQFLARAGVFWGRTVVLGIGGVGMVLAAVGLVGLYGEPGGLAAPIALATSALLLEYSASLASRYAQLTGSLGSLTGAGADLRRGLVAALVVMAAFWAITDVAQDRGRANARLTEASLILQSQAVVYSDKDLQLPVPVDRVTAIGGTDSAYHFRYNGLRPLLYAHNRWFLLPVDWAHDNGSTVIVLEDDPPRVRVDLAP